MHNLFMWYSSTFWAISVAPRPADFHDHLRECAACRLRYQELRQMIRPQAGNVCVTCEGFLGSDKLGTPDCGLAVTDALSDHSHDDATASLSRPGRLNGILT